jgi:serine/threonine protein kinase
MYEEGQVLELRAQGSPVPIKIRIVKLVTPWTLSAVMLVDVLQQSSDISCIEMPERAFLKIYDRRCAEQFRQEWRIDQATPDVERQLLEFSRSGKAAAFLENWRADPSFCFGDDDETPWGVPETETALSERMREIWQTEIEVYKRLAEHQGRRIPKLFAVVTFHISPEDEDIKPPSSSEVFDIPGIIIEYIDGFRLSDLAENTDSSEWNRLVNTAVDVTGEILNDSDVLNEDVRPDNMMVCRDRTWEGGYRLCMIDFGVCRFRGEDEGIEEWGRAKHVQDEEDGMSEIMRIKLREGSNFVLDCRRRLTWGKYAEKEGEDS